MRVEFIKEHEGIKPGESAELNLRKAGQLQAAGIIKFLEPVIPEPEAKSKKKQKTDNPGE
jgi:hypothetical protein